MQVPNTQILDVGGPIIRVMQWTDDRVTLQVYTQGGTNDGCYEPPQFVSLFLDAVNMAKLVEMLQAK